MRILLCESGLSLYMAIELAVSNFIVANLNKYILDNYVAITIAKNLSRALADVDFFLTALWVSFLRLRLSFLKLLPPLKLSLYKV